MNKFLARIRFLAATGLILFAMPILAQEEFLPPDVAFKINIQVADDACTSNCLADVEIDVAEKYYLYRERFKLQLGQQLENADFINLPRGTKKFDEFLNQEIEALRGVLNFGIKYDRVDNSGEQPAILVSQGCADAGLCYPPMETPIFNAAERNGVGALLSAGRRLGALITGGEKSIDIDPRKMTDLSETGDSSLRVSEDNPLAAGISERASDTVISSTNPVLSGQGVLADEAGGLANRLANESLWIVLPIFFGLGLLLAFTPCTLPMLPIVTSLVLGQNDKGVGVRPVALALVYVIGMAATYAVLGMLAGLSGQSLVMAMQQRPVLWSFGALLALLGFLLLRGVSLQVPVSLQNWIQERTGRLKGGQFAPVLIMGVLSALLIGPCVAPPLAGALLYIGQTGDALVGGAALFLLALGMGLPIVLFAAGAGHILPKAGAWMHAVSVGFGFMLLGTALWLVGPVTPLGVMFALWTIWLALIAASLLVLSEGGSVKSATGKVLAKACALIAGVLTAIYLFGFLTSAPSLLKPLHQISGKSSLASNQVKHQFEYIPSGDVMQVIAKSEQPVILDFYADWCVACKEFEVLTFPADDVQKRLGDFKLLKVDVTENNESDKALLKRFQLFGPPALLFFSPSDVELTRFRVVGFQSAERFAKTLDEVRFALEIGR